MSIKKNILANYVTYFYITVVGIIMVPMYVKYMGAEAYGLVAFYSLLNSLFIMLDMGLTPAMARETARLRGGAIDALSLRRLLRALEGIFIGVAVLGAAGIMIGANLIAGRWLKIQNLPLEEVRHAIMLMAVIVALRWVSGLYRSTINGFERQVLLGSIDITVATARFILVIPYLIYKGASPTDFFSYQLVIAVIEVVVFASNAYRLFPRLEPGQRILWQWEPMRGVLNFSAKMAFIVLVSVMSKQIDKIVLSKLLPLADYAYFAVAVLAASGVLFIGGPISAALLPRMSRLSAESNEDGLIVLYHKATQLMAMITVPTSLVLAFFAEQVLWTWTGNIEITHRTAHIMRLYALGNMLQTVGAFPYYLQFAKGDLKLHVIGTALFVAVQIPSVIWCTLHYGVIGAGYAWLGITVAYFILWVPIVHGRFAKGLHSQWMVNDFMVILLPTVTIAALAHSLLKWPNDRLHVALVLALVSLLLFVSAAAGSSQFRRQVSSYLKNISVV